MNEQKDITKMTIEELKALAYDLIVMLQQTQNNINVVQAEIVKRQNDTSAGN